MAKTGNSSNAAFAKTVVRHVDSALQSPVFATMQEVRYAHDLRLRLREEFLSRVVPVTSPWWSVGID